MITGNKFIITRKDEEDMTPEDVILLYIAHKKNSITLRHKDLQRLRRNYCVDRVTSPGELTLFDHKNIFARVLFDILIIGNHNYDIIHIDKEKQFIGSQYIELFNSLTDKYHLNDYLVQYVKYLLLVKTEICISAETIRVFNYKLHGQ